MRPTYVAQKQNQETREAAQSARELARGVMPRHADAASGADASASTQRRYHLGDVPVSRTPCTADGGAIAQLQRNGGHGRRRRKSFKNERSAAAARKRGGELEPELPSDVEPEELPSPGLPEDPSESYAPAYATRFDGAPPGERGGRHGQQKRRGRRPEPPTPRDDSALHLREPSGDTMRVYRAEVETFDERYSHVNVTEGRATLYNPPPAPGGSLPLDGAKYETRPGGYAHPGGGYIPSKKTPKNHSNLQHYSREFLAGRENAPKGTMSWINFGEPERALEFHHQKSNNPTEKALGNSFGIKSFEVPSDVYRAIAADSVHERQKKQHPTKAINVDRAAPNQFGLQQHHLELMNRMQIPGSARVEDPPALARRVGYEPEKPPTKKPKNKAAIPNKGWASKAQRNSLGTSYDEMLAAEEDARAEYAADHAAAEYEDGV